MTTTTATKIVTFKLADDFFAADIHSVERVLRYQQPTPIPNVPEWIEGVLEYQKRVVPVLDLRKRFELPPRDAASDMRILVFNAEGEWIAGIVDQVLEVAPLDREKLAAPPKMFRGLSAEYLRGIVRRDDRLIIYLDVARLLSTNDRLVLERALDDQQRALDDPIVIERTMDAKNG
jgi:purine-binding chemotaxis protein CheW